MKVSRFPRLVFLVAGLYGLAVLVPQYFMEAQIGRDYPPPITHPEHFYGFIGVALAWQLAFLVIATNPARYRPLMLPAIVEKLSFGLAAQVLFAQGRVAAAVAMVAGLDLVLALLFATAWRMTRGMDGARA